MENFHVAQADTDTYVTAGGWKTVGVFGDRTRVQEKRERQGEQWHEQEQEEVWIVNDENVLVDPRSSKEGKLVRVSVSTFANIFCLIPGLPGSNGYSNNTCLMTSVTTLFFNMFSSEKQAHVAPELILNCYWEKIMELCLCVCRSISVFFIQ